MEDKMPELEHWSFYIHVKRRNEDSCQDLWDTNKHLPHQYKNHRLKHRKPVLGKIAENFPNLEKTMNMSKRHNQERSSL